MLMDSLKDAPELAAYTALNSIDFYPVPHYTNFPFVKTGEKNHCSVSAFAIKTHNKQAATY